VGHLSYHNLTYSDLDIARRITEDHNIHVHKIYAHAVHAYDVHAREMHAVRYTPMRYTPMRYTPVRYTPVGQWLALGKQAQVRPKSLPEPELEGSLHGRRGRGVRIGWAIAFHPPRCHVA
jgi:hypothetical protein